MQILLLMKSSLHTNSSKFIKVHPREAGGGRCHGHSALSATLLRKGIGVMNSWMTLPHADGYEQWFTAIYTNTFLKIQNIHTLASLDLNAEHRDSLTVRCLSVFLCSFFLRSAFCQWFCSPSFTRGGLDFWLKWLLRCVWQFGVLYAGIALILPIPWGEEKACSCQHQSGKRKVCQAVVQLGPAHTNTHVTCDGHQRRAQLPSCYWTQGQQLLNALHPLSKQTPWTVRSSFQSDWQIRMTVSSTPPLPHPLLTAPVSHRALAQSTEIVSCLFLNTHLYLTAYWVSISLNVHHVWMCSQACVCGCVCQLLQRVYVSSATCLSCSPLFPILKVCLSIKQQGWREGVGAWQRGGW